MGTRTGNPTWQNAPLGNTPIRADSLENIEQAIDNSAPLVAGRVPDANLPERLGETQLYNTTVALVDERVNNFADHPVATKPRTTPILTKAAVTAPSIYWPCLFDESQVGGTGFSLYFSTDHGSPHTNTGIFRATGATPVSDFTQQGSLVYRDDGGGTQTETPDVIYDPVTDKRIMYYHQDDPPGNVGSQTTMWAESDGDDPTGFVRGGIAADYENASDIGSGHTGYLRAFDIAGDHRAYSLFGGGVISRGSFGLWRTEDRRTFKLDRRLIGSQINLLDNLFTLSVEGTPGSAAGSVTAFSPQYGVKMNSSAAVLWRGAYWWIGLAGPLGGGLQANINKIVAAPLRADLLGLAAAPVDITPPVQAWEGDGIDGLGAAVIHAGRLYIPYRANGPQGAFGILEVK